MSAKQYIGWFLTSHGWNVISKDEQKIDLMNSSWPISPLPPDSVKQMFKDIGPWENTPEFHALEKTAGFSYLTVLGKMMYAYITCRPDIGYAVTTLSKFSSTPSSFHSVMFKNIAKYLRSTINWGIWFRRPKSLSHLDDGNVYTFNDSEQNFPVDINERSPNVLLTDTRKVWSITGLVFTYCGGAIVYRSKTQSLTAQSSTEAEFIAAYTAVKIPWYLQHILQQLGFKQKKPTPIYIDNESALKIINENTAPTDRTRHIDIRFFSLQDWRLDGDIIMHHILGTLNPSNDLTKSLGWVLYAWHCRRLMGHYGCWKWSKSYLN